MAEKMMGFQRGIKRNKIFAQQCIIKELEKLSLQQCQTAPDQNTGRTPFATIFDPFQNAYCQPVNNNSNMNFLKQSQSSSQCYQKLFLMLCNFKYQDQQTKIENFHDLLYQFSINNNLVGIFVDFLPQFQTHNFTFQQQIGWLVKFATDRNNTYAIKFLSNLIHSVIQQIPEYSTNNQKNISLVQILFDSLQKLPDNENLYSIIKAIFSVTMANISLTKRILHQNGNILIKYFLKNYDYSSQYMLIKIIKQGNPQYDFIYKLAKEIFDNFIIQQQNLPKVFVTRQSYHKSLYRILKQIEKLNPNLIKEQFSSFFINNGIDVDLQQLSKISLGVNNEHHHTRTLIQQFKKIRLSQNESTRRQQEQKMDEQLSIANRYPRKIFKWENKNDRENK